MILCPLLPAFFSKFPMIYETLFLLCNFVTYLFFSLVLSFFFSFFCWRARCFHDIFSPSGHIYSPPPRGGGGYFPIYRPLEGNQIHSFKSSSGSFFSTSYGSGSASQKVTFPTVPVPQHWWWCLYLGPSDVPRVSQYRLAAHLSSAVILYSLFFWNAKVQLLGFWVDRLDSLWDALYRSTGNKLLHIIWKFCKSMHKIIK